MATQKLQGYNAIAVVPSDTIGIPDIATESIDASTATALNANKLEDNTQSFSDNNTAKIGSIVYNTDDGTIATVTAVDSNTVLSLSANIFPVGNENYRMFAEETKNCVIYVGVAGDLEVIMAEDSDDVPVIFTAAPVGYHPIHVKQVKAANTAATNIVALF